MKHELRCDSCGKVMTYSIPSCYPGTSEPVATVEPCCMPYEDAESIQICKDEIDDSISTTEETYEDAKKYLEVVKRDLNEFITKLSPHLKDDLPDEVWELVEFDFEFEELARIHAWFERKLSIIEQNLGEVVLP